MKHNLKYVISLVFMLLLTQSTWADPTVTIIKKLNGAVVTETSPGEVTQSIANSKCTLTVTPAQGYYVTKDFITAYSVVTGGVAQTPRRSPDLDNDPIEVSNKGENTDPTGETTYEFTMPADGSDVEVTVDFHSYQSYNLFIGETQVTDLNAENVLGDSKVVFSVGGNDAPVYTLTLNGAELTAPLIVGLENLTIDIQGENTITTTGASLQKMDNTNPSLTFKSTSTPVGSLILSKTEGEGSVNQISNCSFSRELTYVVTRAGYYYSIPYYLADYYTSEIKVVPSLGVKVGDLQVYYGNKANVLGDEETPTVVYDAENHKLTLNGANAGVISTSLDNLIIELVGNNTLTSGASDATLQSMYGEAVTMTIQSTGTSKGSLTMNQPYTQAGTFTDEHVTLDIISPLTILSGSLTGNKDNENTIVIGAYTIKFAGNNSWASYYVTEDLAVPEGLTAYIVDEADDKTGVVTVSAIGYIPRYEAVLLKRTNTAVSEYIATAYDDEEEEDDIINLLEGTYQETSVESILEGYVSDASVYVLYNNEFVKTTSGTIPANRGYLVFGKPANAPKLTIEIGDGATGINDVRSKMAEVGSDFYDLSGRKLSGKPTKSGLYIKNGTKVLVK